MSDFLEFLRMRRMRQAAGLIALLGAGACRDRTEVTIPPAVAPPPAAPGVLLSTDAMTVGSVARVHGIFRAPEGFPPVGSFAFRVAFDTTKLAFVEDRSSGAGMRLMHASEGVLSIAGATTGGFGSETTFVAAFRVIGTDAAASLSLDIAELHGTRFENLLPTLEARSVRVRGPRSLRR